MSTFLQISLAERRQGVYIIGTSGTGKSTFLANTILSDIAQGFGACLIEPHGDLTNTVLGGIPDERTRDVILLDLADSDLPFGLNLFQCSDLRKIAEVTKTADFVQHVFEKIWGVGTDTPQLMQVLRAATRTLIENPGTTFAEIPMLFSDESVREKMVRKLTNDSIISFWRDYNCLSAYHQREYVKSTLNKITAFLDDPMIRNIVGQSVTTVDFRYIMDERKILLVKLSPQFKAASLLIGGVIIGKLLLAAWSREDILDEEERQQFYLYCDEYQRFATSDFADFIEGARKFRVAVTLSHQTLAQLDEKNRAAATQAASLIVFRVRGDDAKELAKNFDTTPTREAIGDDPVRAPATDVIGHLVRRGHSDLRVAKFAQSYLRNLENFLRSPTHVGICGSPASYQSAVAYPPVVLFSHQDIQEGRELLNAALYQSMIEPDVLPEVPPLGMYMLAVAQQDGSANALLPFLKTEWLGGLELRGFTENADILGDLSIIGDIPVVRWVASRKDHERPAADAIRKMRNELRYAMEVLGEEPVLVDTGQYQPRYQSRQYADMENQIARDLTQQENFEARVKVPAGEYVIRSGRPPQVLTGQQLTTRINMIKRRMKADRYCRDYREVEKEIRERQERLRAGHSAGPPPTDF